MNGRSLIDLTPTNAAQVGDLITYSYHFTRWGIRDFGVVTRAITGIEKDDEGTVIGYHVEGGWFVPVKNVQSVISTEVRGQKSEVSTTHFPLETGQ